MKEKLKPFPEWFDVTTASRIDIMARSQQALGEEWFRCWGCSRSSFDLWRDTARCRHCRAYYLLSPAGDLNMPQYRVMCYDCPGSAQFFNKTATLCRGCRREWPWHPRVAAHAIASEGVIDVLKMRGVLDMSGKFKERGTIGTGTERSMRYQMAKVKIGREPFVDYRRMR